MKISFQPKLKPYLLQLKKFTSYRLKYVLSLHSVYSIRLYELVKKWQVTSIEETQKIIELEELRGKMGAIAKSYKRYSQFKQLLNDAIFDLNEKTDVFISFEEIKVGRSVKSLRFKIRENLNTVEVPSIENNDSESLTDNLSELEIEFMKMEEMRLRINEKAKAFSFDDITFFEFYNSLKEIFGKDIEIEFMYLIEYINDPSSEIENPIGFIKYKVKELLQMHQKGGKGSFKSLVASRNKKPVIHKSKQNLPDWFIEAQRKKEIAKAEAEASATRTTTDYNAKMEEIKRKFNS